MSDVGTTATLRVSARQPRDASASEPAGNDDEPFEDFYRRRFAPMVRLAALVVGPPEDAVDIVQDAFASVYSRYERVRSGNADAYLQTSTLNGCRRFLRRRNLALKRARRDRPVPAELAADHILDAVRHLRSHHRDVVLLRFYLDLSEAEIASALRIRPGTVKSRLNRALSQLREALA